MVQKYFRWVNRWVSRWESRNISLRARPANTLTYPWPRRSRRRGNLCVDKIGSRPRGNLCVDIIGSRPRGILCVDKMRSRPRGILWVRKIGCGRGGWIFKCVELQKSAELGADIHPPGGTRSRQHYPTGEKLQPLAPTKRVLTTQDNNLLGKIRNFSIFKTFAENIKMS